MLLDLYYIDTSDHLPDITRLVPLKCANKLCQSLAPNYKRFVAAMLRMLVVLREHLTQRHAHVHHLVVGKRDEVSQEVSQEKRLRGRVEQ